jgi:hypothetical protein
VTPDDGDAPRVPTSTTERREGDPGGAGAEGVTAQPTGWEWHVEIPYVGPVGWPLTGSLSYLITVGALAALEVVTWPVAGVLGLAHIMARNRDNPVLSEIGKGLRVAG